MMKNLVNVTCFLAEPSDPESHYSIFEDNHGTHIFANNDLDLMTKLTELVEHGFTIGSLKVSTLQAKTL